MFQLRIRKIEREYWFFIDYLYIAQSRLIFHTFVYTYLRAWDFFFLALMSIFREAYVRTYTGTFPVVGKYDISVLLLSFYSCAVPEAVSSCRPHELSTEKARHWRRLKKTSRLTQKTKLEGHKTWRCAIALKTAMTSQHLQHFVRKPLIACSVCAIQFRSAYSGLTLSRWSASKQL